MRNDRVEVPAWALLYAIRYGMGRMTYANADVAELAKQHWDGVLKDHHDTIRADAWRLRGHERTPWEWLVGPESHGHGGQSATG